MMKQKTADLKWEWLDAAVAKAQGWRFELVPTGNEGPLCQNFHCYAWVDYGDWRAPSANDFIRERYWPNSSWEQAGPIIEREKISIVSASDPWWDSAVPWRAGFRLRIDETNVDVDLQHEQGGPTPLIAAMRAFVASKLGDVVDLPEEATPRP